MDEIGLNELLQLIIRDKGGTPKQYNQLMDYVAYHETGAKQRMDPKAKQISGNEKDGFYDGPGRGLFMFEKGEKKGGNTAVNRTVKYFNDNNLSLPKWLYDLSMGSKESKSVDVSVLNADQQKMLFLGNHREHPNSNFSNIWTGKQTIDDFWLKNHWSGDADESAIKLDMFNKSMAHKDSTEALNAERERLMYKQNMAPYLSDSNNINKLPSTNDILDSIFGAQDSSLTKDSSLIKEYNHGGVHLPVAESDATYVQQPQFNIPIAQEEQYFDQFGSTGGSLYPSGPEPTLWEKIKNTGANPLGAFGYSARGEEIPWGNVPRHGNAFDTFALGMFNPFAWGESLDASVEAGKQGDYLGMGLEGLGAIPTVPAGLSAGKKLAPWLSKTTKGGVSKTKASDLQLVDKPPVPTSTANINTYKAREIKNVVLKRKTYLLSDEYITKRAANTGESPNQIKAHIDTYLRELDNTTMGMYKEGDLGKNIGGDYGSQGVRINKDMSYEEILGAIDHEVGHLLSPVNRSAMSGNPHNFALWKDKKTGKKLTVAESEVHKGDLDFDINPKHEAWEKEYAKLYENYPTIKMEVKGDEEFAKYLMKPQEQQVRMVRYGEILKKHGWDGTKKGLTDDIIKKSVGEGYDSSWRHNKIFLGSSKLPFDVQQLLRNMKGINPGSSEWYAQIKKTLPHAWAMAPVAATTLQE